MSFVCSFIFLYNKGTAPPGAAPSKKNKKGLASVILATNSPKFRIGESYINRKDFFCQGCFDKKSNIFRTIFFNALRNLFISIFFYIFLCKFLHLWYNLGRKRRWNDGCF